MRTAQILLSFILFAPGCSKPEPGTPGAQGRAIELQGAGATFPYPLYSKWIAEYQKVDPQVRINYQSIGSGGGIRQILERTVDFGASDAVMTDAELARAPGKLVHVPTTLGAVVVGFNVAGVSGLRLTPEVLAAIFLGEITRWSDPRLAAANPGVRLPDAPLSVVHRTDGSGTTAVFTEYLAKISPTWRERVGAGKSVKFPTGLGAKGNEGVAGQLRTSPGTIGYLELAYAKQTGIQTAAIRNRGNLFIEPSLAGISAAAAGVSMPEDLRVSIVDPPAASAYPIAAFSYILAFEEQADASRGKALTGFLWWAIHEGQKLGPGLHYAPLPGPVVTRIEARLRSRLRAGGQPLLSGR